MLTDFNPFKAEHIRAKERQRLQQCLALSLLLVLILSFAARYITVSGNLDFDQPEAQNVSLALEAIMMKKPPPPPMETKIIPPPVVQPPDKVPDEITTKIKVIPDPPRRKPDPKSLKLNLPDNLAERTTTSSAMGEIDGPRSNRRAPEPGRRVELGANLYRGNDPTLSTGPGNLDLGETRAQMSRRDSGEKLELSLAGPATPEPETSRRASTSDETDLSGFLNADVSVVLASTDLSMGGEEYQLWNKINGEFDRWDKGRYGALPSALTRRGRAIVATFQYPDGSAQRIVWLRGNTKIYVLGKTNRNRIEELQLALTSIIQLNIKKRG